MNISDTLSSTTTCPRCRGACTTQEAHNWSDGLGMVDGICDPCQGRGKVGREFVLPSGTSVPEPLAGLTGYEVDVLAWHTKRPDQWHSHIGESRDGESSRKLLAAGLVRLGKSNPGYVAPCCKPTVMAIEAAGRLPTWWAYSDDGRIWSVNRVGQGGLLDRAPITARKDAVQAVLDALEASATAPSGHPLLAILTSVKSACSKHGVPQPRVLRSLGQPYAIEVTTRGGNTFEIQLDDDIPKHRFGGPHGMWVESDDTSIADEIIDG